MHRVVGEYDLEETRFSTADALDVYRDVVRARRFDERAIALQRRGWMSGYPPFRGQEASQVGAAHALADEDWLVPTYRSNAMQIAFGVPMADVLRFRRGHPEFVSDHDLNVFPQAVPIATQIPHATGLGMAASYADNGEAVCCYFGDGATSEGDFHEGLNLAGVFDAPVVFFCENNGWAISLPRERQTASETIAQKANAYGFEGVRVDGNDPLAVGEVVADALESARAGEPVLVESLTYRQGAHTTSDDPSRYRADDADRPAWRTADPLERYEEYLREHGVLDDDRVESIREAADAEIDEAVEAAETTPDPDPADVFDPVYDERPPRLEAQNRWLETFVADRRTDDLEFE
ncbi:pyruvate dehydrogenase (acetyl-transferring) E1 component subunit alpha [Natrarchaeobius sp. A-rgal3]|uniref:pyruvate dehydrogenase (acetyl-transferring) E1 component subunit alpha n=1 Tax=Natrarchaeobius versutus TaxID=1679078 RepID=UPI003510BAD5